MLTFHFVLHNTHECPVCLCVFFSMYVCCILSLKNNLMKSRFGPDGDITHTLDDTYK